MKFVALSVDRMWAEAAGCSAGCPRHSAICENDAGKTKWNHWGNRWKTRGGGPEERDAYILSESEYAVILEEKRKRLNLI